MEIQYRILVVFFRMDPPFFILYAQGCHQGFENLKKLALFSVTPVRAQHTVLQGSI